MKNLFALVGILLVAGCAGTPQDDYAYRCTDGDTVYYANHHSAIIVTDERVVLGDCEPTSKIALITQQDQ